MLPQWLKPSTGAFPRPITFSFPIALGRSDNPEKHSSPCTGWPGPQPPPWLHLRTLLLQGCVDFLYLPCLCSFFVLVSTSAPWCPFPPLIQGAPDASGVMSSGETSFSCLVAELRPTLCNPMDCSMPGFLVLHHLLEFAQIHVHWVGDAIQPSRPLLSPSLSAFDLMQHQGLFQ